MPRLWDTLGSWEEIVRTQTPKGDARVIDHLVGIVTNEEVHIDARRRALGLACALADDKQAPRLLDTFMTFLKVRDLLDDPKPLDEGLFQSAQARLYGAFAYGVLNHLKPLLSDQRAILDVVTASYILGGTGMAREGELCVAQPRGFFDPIKSCEAPLELRQEAVCRIIAKGWRRGVSEEIQFQLPDYPELLDPVIFPRLRELVRAENTPDRFHWGAAEILSFLGDTEILSDLEARRAPFRAVHTYHEEAIMRYIWRIQVQHPPTQLLEYIASVGWPLQRDRRAWAVCRALSLGIPPAQIREAILKHHKRVKTRDERVDLDELKWLGLELGILKKDDMPDVDIASGPKVST
ncbi:MAG: hypothetical protein V2A79_11330 [Planctomycetota bacterium]